MDDKRTERTDKDQVVDEMNYPNACPDVPEVMNTQHHFLNKLFQCLMDMEEAENQMYSEFISWVPHGQCFIIKDEKRFTDEVMPK